MELDSLLGRGTPSGGGEVRYRCPLCPQEGKGEDRKGHLYVNGLKGVFICFRCGSRGSLTYLQSRMGLQPGEVVPPTADMLDSIRVFLEGSIVLEEDLEYPCEVVPVTPGSPGYIYLVGTRGYHSWVIRDHRMVEGDYHGHRVFVPTYVGEKMKFWVARTTEGKEPKYLNPPSTQKTCVFNLNNVPPGRPLIVCEGVFSAISCHPWAVALFGKDPTAAQILELLNFNAPMYFIALDGDAPAQAEDLAEKLSVSQKPIRIIELPKGEDPDTIAPGSLWTYPIRTFDASYRLDRVLDKLTLPAVS